MSQLFPKSANSLARASHVIVAALGGAVLLLVLNWNRMPWVNNQGVARDQPVPFSHQHHVGGMGVDCRYCHTSVEVAATAGIPPTKTCMNCHSQIWADSPTLEPVRASFREGRSLQWTRVYDLPDFAYFDHSAHVTHGVGCSTCHGRIDLQPLTYQVPSLQMEWCLDCHKAPEKYVRPKSEVFNIAYQPPANQLELGRRLVKEYGIKTRISCSTCHR